MDTNDYRSHGDESNTNQPVHPYGAPPQTGFGYYGNYGPNPTGQDGNNSGKKGKKLRIAIISIIMVICLVAGGLLTAYVIMPPAQTQIGDIPDLSLSSSVSSASTAQQSVDSAITQQDLTTESPEIGGEMPNIDNSGNTIVQIAEKVGPSVVGVTVSADQMTEGQGITQEEYGYGTGIIFTSDGYIATNNHVVSESDSVKVTLYDGSEYQASVVGTDTTTDIAVLKIDATGLKAAAFGNSDELQVGETVVAIGNPLGTELAGSVTSGIVSALNREITTNGYSQKYIQTDAAINPGNSGGPLLNSKGEVIGITTLKSYLAGYDDYGVPIGTEGIGFAIPISAAVPIIDQLTTQGSISRPGIGISCLVDETGTYNSSDAPAGVTVAEVVTGGPAGCCRDCSPMTSSQLRIVRR